MTWQKPHIEWSTHLQFWDLPEDLKKKITDYDDVDDDDDDDDDDVDDDDYYDDAGDGDYDEYQPQRRQQTCVDCTQSLSPISINDLDCQGFYINF